MFDNGNFHHVVFLVFLSELLCILELLLFPANFFLKCLQVGLKNVLCGLEKNSEAHFVW